MHLIQGAPDEVRSSRYTSVSRLAWLNKLTRSTILSPYFLRIARFLKNTTHGPVLYQPKNFPISERHVDGVWHQLTVHFLSMHLSHLEPRISYRVSVFV